VPERIDAHFVAAGKYHDIDFARLEILKLLAEHAEIRTTVACDYSNIDRLNECSMLAGGKWLALHGTNSILKFVEGGVDTPDLRPDVMDVLGTQFKAHPPIGTFNVEVVNKEHELSKGIDDFEIEDELYLSVTTAEIDVLMTPLLRVKPLALLTINGHKQPCLFCIPESLVQVKWCITP